MLFRSKRRIKEIATRTIRIIGDDVLTKVCKEVKVLLNATTYLNILDRNKSSLSWYKYLLLFDDTPKNIIVPLMGVGIIIITIFGFYLYGRNKDKW